MIFLFRISYHSVLRQNHSTHIRYQTVGNSNNSCWSEASPPGRYCGANSGYYRQFLLSLCQVWMEQWLQAERPVLVIPMVSVRLRATEVSLVSGKLQAVVSLLVSGLLSGDGVRTGLFVEVVFFLTITLQINFLDLILAVILAVPAFFAVTVPFLFTVAIFLFDDFHVILPEIPLTFSL